jgi:hypothetical protein
MVGPSTTSEIDHVTVYSRGARVRRITSTGIAAGEVRLSGLPLDLADDTVRAEIVGGGAVIAVRVELDAARVTERADDALDAAVRAARARVAAIEAEIGRIGVALGAIAKLAPVDRRPRPDGAAVPAWSKILDARLALLELRVGRDAALREALAAAQREQRDAREALAAARDRAERGSTGRGLHAHELCKVVVATVDAPAADARVAVEYLVAAARWAPTYAARLAGGKAELELRAVVAQHSGEDWRGARLVLSTAEPMRFAELPELPMARIGRRQPHLAKKGFRAPPAGVETLYQDFDRAFPGRTQRADPRPFTDRHSREEITQERAVSYSESAPMMSSMPPPPAAEFDTDEGAGFHTRLADDYDNSVAPSRARQREQAPPPPRRAPGGLPAPSVAMPVAPQAAKARGGGIVGAIAGAPFAAVAALGGAVAKSVAGKADMQQVARGYGGDAAATVEPIVGDDAAGLLAYGEVRMMAAGDAGRGRLVRVGVFARYAEAFAARGMSLAADADLVTAIGSRSAKVDAMILPPGAESRWDHFYDHAYTCDARVDVPSDASWHALTVTAKSAPVTVRHVVVPREGTEVYRVAELANPLGAPLLPGPIDVFDDGVYLLTSHVESVPAGAHVELGLGVDPKVKASRNTDYREEASGMLRGSLKLEHEIEVEVVNHSARPIDVEIRERLPVVDEGDDDIELTVTRTEPRWERWTPEPDGPHAARLRGGHRWRLAIPAGETRKAVAAYAIRIASKHELVGGNRRES